MAAPFGVAVFYVLALEVPLTQLLAEPAIAFPSRLEGVVKPCL
ncbi:hypothetical protein [Trichocoleus sp. FACHB-262]|nr:hypothetical protein [Trichocoleus sp. FACHB-262]